MPRPPRSRSRSGRVASTRVLSALDRPGGAAAGGLDFDDRRAECATSRPTRAHVDASVWRNGRVDPKLLDPVCRLSGSGYAALGDLVTVQRPQSKDIEGTIGMDLCPGRSGDNASSGSAKQDQARLRRRGALVGRSAASSVFRLRPPLTGSNKAG